MFLLLKADVVFIFIFGENVLKSATLIAKCKLQSRPSSTK